MKKITSILMLASALMIMGSCTKIKESPAPETITNNNGGSGGGGGGGGNQNIYIGMWKLEKTTWSGAEVPPDSTFAVTLNTGGQCVWNWYKPGSPNIVSTASMTFILKDKDNPPVIEFQIIDPPYSKRTIKTKTDKQIVWTYTMPGGIDVEETLAKQ